MAAISNKIDLRFIDAMKSLLELEYEIIEVYSTVIKNLKNKKYQSKLKEFKDDHLRHIKGFTYILEQLDQQAPQGSLSHVKLTINGIPINKLSNDKVIFKTLDQLAQNTNIAYEKVNHFKPKSPMAGNVLKLALETGTRHRNWLQMASSLPEK